MSGMRMCLVSANRTGSPYHDERELLLPHVLETNTIFFQIH